MHNISESLPLFRELEPAHGKRAVRGRSLSPHLRAARRLSRVVRKLPDYSDEQTRAGQAICRHLIALLAEPVREPIDSNRKNCGKDD